jgi:hypothetical protein
MDDKIKREEETTFKDTKPKPPEMVKVNVWHVDARLGYLIVFEDGKEENLADYRVLPIEEWNREQSFEMSKSDWRKVTKPHDASDEIAKVMKTPQRIMKDLWKRGVIYPELAPPDERHIKAAAKTSGTSAAELRKAFK